MFTWSTDAEGIATVTLAMDDVPVNVWNARSVRAFAETLEEVLAQPGLRGLVLRSGRETFLAGADLTALMPLHDLERNMLLVHELRGALRRLETSGIPAVAAIDGSALGGGYELCLACHHRLARADERIRIGLPEVKLGLLPGAGGTQRLPRLIGIRAALPLLVEGQTLGPRAALAAGLVDQLADSDLELLRLAREWILSGKEAVQPWDRKEERIPGGGVQSPAGTQTFMAASALVQEKTHGKYPAPLAILRCVYEGLQLPFERGMELEGKLFARCLASPVAAHTIRTMFFGLNAIKKGAGRPPNVPVVRFGKIAVLGAGMMGSGIAYAAASRGMEVVLKDVDAAAAARGKAHTEKLLARRLEKGRTTDAEASAVLARIRPTARAEDLAGCALVIEAVFESRAVKEEAIREAERVLGPEAIVASNTSTLPITSLAACSGRPAQFLGLHFFSPVDRMPLVEIIRGRDTSDATVAHAFDLVRALGKTPIVVNDGRGFYTSRVFAAYVHAGIAALQEGVAPALIENAGRMAGMPVGPLAVADEVSLDLIHHIATQTAEDTGLPDTSPGAVVARLFVETLHRNGRKVGRGFYDYPTDGKKHLWPGLAEHFPLRTPQPAVEDLERRLLHAQAVEAARAFEEGIVTSARDGDVGSILGWGFAPWTGGVFSYMDGIGLPRFVGECQALGYEPPELLQTMAREGRCFHDGA
ncbi:MAG TPA: 3-hydroxyacyl-CoA dehydrogenase NAD-binding domain-containing protein [Candidatus Polarisedimenticolaceae bacterium]|nr:3-hydroxyacyl-CoA dehydrogenase NAD-binding domain-containing protein [Candidatus Polarisedimenticolaceae bacterium]